MKRNITVAAQWEEYRKKSIPRNAPQIQIQEMRRSFYMGAYMILMEMAQQLGNEEITEQEGAESLEEIKNECEQFIQMIGVLH
jgi:hypothetical protein